MSSRTPEFRARQARMDEEIRRLNSQGLGWTEMARILPLAASTIGNRGRKMGLTVQRKSLAAIAAEAGVHKSTIGRRIQKHEAIIRELTT